VEEIPTLPPSVAEVSTAVPAFIGYTEKGPAVARIDTLLEYEEIFGGAKPRSFTVTTGTNKAITDVSRDGNDSDEFLMYYCINHYFKNGGGRCYVFSIGDYSQTLSKDDFLAGLDKLEKEDEPTLILLTDAVRLATADYYEVCGQVLNQCRKLGDRFAIFDVKDGDVDDFRNSIGINHLMYGAAYHPYLRTSLNYIFQEDGVTIEGLGAAGPSLWEKTFGSNGIMVRYQGVEGDTPRVRIVQGNGSNPLELEIAAGTLTIRNTENRTGNDVAAGWMTWAASNDAAGFEVTADGDGSGDVPHTSNVAEPLDPVSSSSQETLASIKASETALYNAVKTALAGERITLPPSAAVAGVYASVDRSRGVWKAPANVSVSAVIEPEEKISHADQEELNVDPTGGKSINAIRAFTGRGTLVWGARTLAGNDNEWRYISVRRLFNMIEESARKSTSFAVFEPNDMTTWLKVKGMIESYLYGLWEKGALAGSTPEAAYFVNVGLGKTMTAQDILEGRMIVELGIAAVRPAEFIILRFSHKMQEA
jgi:phage tail sheath protein FI